MRAGAGEGLRVGRDKPEQVMKALLGEDTLHALLVEYETTGKVFGQEVPPTVPENQLKNVFGKNNNNKEDDDKTVEIEAEP